LLLAARRDPGGMVTLPARAYRPRRTTMTTVASTVERPAAVVAQTWMRLAGQMPQSATRLVSRYDPDARPIREGRINRPVEFGYKPRSRTATTRQAGARRCHRRLRLRAGSR
jgi:hypothetical protein